MIRLTIRSLLLVVLLFAADLLGLRHRGLCEVLSVFWISAKSDAAAVFSLEAECVKAFFFFTMMDSK